MANDVMGEVWQYNPDYHRVADFLGVSKYDRKDYDVAKKISFIVDAVSEGQKPRNTGEILKRIYKSKRSLGVQSEGKLLLGELFQYHRIKQDTSNAPKRVQKPSQVAQVNPISSSIQKTIGKYIPKIIEKAMRGL